MQEEAKNTNRLTKKESCKPLLVVEVEIDKHVWMQILAIIDVSAMSTGTQICDEFGCEYMPILMIHVHNSSERVVEPL